MTKKKVYYLISLFVLALPILVFLFSLINIGGGYQLLTIPSDFYSYFVKDDSFFFICRLVDYVGIWDSSVVSSITIGVDLYIWFSVLFALSELFTFITDLLNIWRKKD